jgi:uncharacterized NAD-dependent epimerase/dehydratase family protein
MLTLRKPYLVYLGDATLKSDCKTGFGLRDWCRDDVLAEWSHPKGTVTLGLERLAPAEAAARGAGSLIVGVAPMGGMLAEHWIADLEAALLAGLDVVSGMHTRLGTFPRLAAAAATRGARLIDVRHTAGRYPVGSGRKRSGKRVLTVGTDCALGKKYTALALARELLERGAPATFRATGQTGIMIAGSGIPMDAIVADFLAGAAEQLTPDNAPDHWDVVEGQGSLLHPSYAAVTLGLLHGSQPDAIVLCHDPERLEIEDCPGYAIPPLAEVIDLYLRCGRLTNAAIRCVGLSINSSSLEERAWNEYRSRLERELAVPVCDPLRGGVGPLAAALLAR